MKALNFNKNSWHYRLVDKLQLYEAPYQKDIWGDGELYQMGDSGDICTYSKQVFFGLLIVVSTISLFIMFSMIIIETLFGIYFSILMGQWFFSELGLLGFVLMVIGIVGFTVYKTLNSYYRYKQRHRWDTKKPKQDTFLSNAYKSWKDKFCVPINFE